MGETTSIWSLRLYTKYVQLGMVCLVRLPAQKEGRRYSGSRGDVRFVSATVANHLAMQWFTHFRVLTRQMGAIHIKISLIFTQF